MRQLHIPFGDVADAEAYWRDKEWKKWAVEVAAGPARRPTFARTLYVGARTQERAIECAKQNLTAKPPRGARFSARLAGPRELGALPAPFATTNTGG
jgi:hypothetical protein